MPLVSQIAPMVALFELTADQDVESECNQRENGLLIIHCVSLLIKKCHLVISINVTFYKNWQFLKFS